MPVWYVEPHLSDVELCLVRWILSCRQEYLIRKNGNYNGEVSAYATGEGMGGEAGDHGRADEHKRDIESTGKRGRVVVRTASEVRLRTGRSLQQGTCVRVATLASCTTF